MTATKLGGSIPGVYAWRVKRRMHDETKENCGQQSPLLLSQSMKGRPPKKIIGKYYTKFTPKDQAVSNKKRKMLQLLSKYMLSDMIECIETGAIKCLNCLKCKLCVT